MNFSVTSNISEIIQYAVYLTYKTRFSRLNIVHIVTGRRDNVSEMRPFIYKLYKLYVAWNQDNVIIVCISDWSPRLCMICSRVSQLGFNKRLLKCLRQFIACALNIILFLIIIAYCFDGGLCFSLHLMISHYKM